VPTQQEEFENIAMPHLAALLRVARRLTPEPASAEDLVQETMLLAWRGFQQFEPGTNARAWLFRILFNAFHAAGRKAHPDAPPSQKSFRPMLQERVEIAEALDALPLEQRTVVLLAVVEGFTCQEIAGILETPIGTVMSRLSRARQELRKSLAPMAKEAYR
jgi:RNA polymerase sigma-70 factor (ECF subfamily)